MSCMWLLVACLVLCVTLVWADTPHFKWAQDGTKLYITIDVVCTDNRDVALTDEYFSFGCDTSAGRQDLKFQLREDIVAANSTCTTLAHPRKGEFCELLKKGDEHDFDRLVENPKAFKKVMSADWKMGKSKDDDEGDDFFDGTPVKQVGGKKLDKMLKEQDFLVLHVEWPWCRKCDHTRDKFIDLARKMKKSKAKFVSTDPRDNRALRAMFEPVCDYTCYFHVHRKDEGPYKVKYQYDLDAMTESMKKFGTDLLDDVDDQKELDKFVKANPQSVLGVFKSKDDEAAKTFRATAIKFRGQYPFAVAYGKEIEGVSKAPSITVYKPFDEGSTKYEGDFESVEAVGRFVNVSSLASVMEYDYNLKDKLAGIGMFGVHFWTDAPSKEADERMELMKKVSKVFFGDAYFVRFNETQHRYLKDAFGAKSMVVGIQETMDHDALKYAYEGELTEDGLKSWIQKYKDGELKPSFKSEDVPTEDWEAGTVKKIVQKTLDAERTSESWVLTTFYKTYFDEWKDVEPVIAKVAKIVKVFPDITIGQYNHDENYFNEAWFEGANTKPMVHKTFMALFHPKNESTTVFAGPFKQGKILNFLKSNVPFVADKWSDVQGSIKAVAEQEQAEKEAAEAARKKEEEEFDAEHPKINVTEDGGIVKQIIEEGDGAVPKSGSNVQAHYHGTLLDGSVFDSSRERDEPFEFKLGQQMVIKCWDQAFATMKVGEQARLTCTSDYAYGDRGSPPKIPAKATLRFDVELLGFEADEAEEEELDEHDEL